MEFDIHHRKRQVADSYSRDVMDIAYSFSKKVYKEFAKFIKVIALFGSTARKKHGTKGDIDILVIVDDVSVVVDQEFAEAYRLIMRKIVAEVEPRKLHITTLKFTSFWEYVRSGDPVAVNILRDGVPIIDSGLFEPLQILLYQGRIRPTPESTWSYFNKAPITLNNAKWHVRQGVLDLYWAVIDSAHAALMRMNEVPPSPDHVADMLEEKLVVKGLLDKKYAQTARKFYALSRSILHGQVNDVKGEQFDEYWKEASEFVDEMKKIVEGRR
ncbi:nucleotidyltransferase domain-containing protein [Candidatus Woesearchaeota archaeon]|nr:nucleotidyltransferase domain-containing protein [Candidatus Woesearchaeota archaeon]